MILVGLHPCKTCHPNRVSNYIQYFDELDIDCFDFFNGFSCSDMHTFGKLKTLSINSFELNCNQNKNKRKRNLIPIEISKNE